MTALLVFLVVVPGTLGDLLNSAGMKRQGELRNFSIHGLLSYGASLARNMYIVASLPAMAISFFSLMALFSVENVSFVVPVTAASYLLDTLLARFLLKERVDWRRWLGAAFVALGIIALSI